MHILIDIILVVLAVDFSFGLFHWFEDSYGNPEFPVTGKWITRPNNLHHLNPNAFTTNTWLHSAAVLLIIGAGVVVAAWAIGMLSWQLLVFVAIGVNANEIHKWNHQPQKKRHTVVVWLQSAGMLQTAKHHGRHHSGTKDCHYCVITNVVNPPLETIHFWRGLEWLIAQAFGIHKRPEPSGQRQLELASPNNSAGANQ